MLHYDDCARVPGVPSGGAGGERRPRADTQHGARGRNSWLTGHPPMAEGSAARLDLSGHGSPHGPVPCPPITQRYPANTPAIAVAWT
jgi:hypothetical protein